MKKILAFTLTILATVFAVVNATATSVAPFSLSDATVTTDKTDYQPGETVVISGSGFAAGEAVAITLKEDPAKHADTSLSATADEYGNFVSQDFSPNAEHVGTTFTLKAVGQTSGRSAETQFTDGPNWSYSSVPNPATFNVTTDGSSHSVNATVNVIAPDTGGGKPSASNVITVTQMLSPGATPIPNSWLSITPSTLTFNTSPQTKSWNVNVTVPPYSAAGSYSTQLKANPPPGKGGSGSGITITVNVTADDTAPNTSLVATNADSSSYNGSDWTNQDVTIALSATDTGTPTTGVALTQYKIDAAPSYTTYSAPFTISAQGLHTILYLSKDFQGNVESPTKSFTVKIDKTKPVITLNGAADMTIVYGSGPFMDPGTSATDSGGSGLAGPVSTTGSVGTSVGDYTLSYNVSDKAGNAADTVTRTVHVIKADQTINGFNPIADKTYGDPDFSVSATSGSGGTVSFSSTGDCTVTGTNVHITGAGSCTVTANQPGDDNYNAAPPVSQSFDIAKADAICSINGYTGSYDAAAHGATGSCAGVDAGGAALGSSLDLGDSFTNAPGGTANWSFTGGNNYNDQSGSVNIAIAKADAICNVRGYTGVYDGAAHGASGSCAGVDAGGAAAGSSLNLGGSFTDYPGGVANWSFSGGTNYNDQNGSVQITINKAATSTVVTCTAGPFTYNGSAQTPCTASVTGPVGLNQSLTVSYLNNTNAGTATASASYGGATNYLSSSDSKNFTINKANATINVTGYTGYYDGAAHGATGTATGVLGENLSSLLNLGSTFTNVPGGTANWTFNSSNTNTNYNSASGTANIVIKAWTMTGFYQPVDMIPVGVLNTVKGGSTVPMKFELFVGTTEKMSVSDIKSFQFQEFTCGSTSTFEAPIEVTTTGGTMLRYDTTAGQFIQNWQTPKTAGKCYQVRVTAQDGSYLDAFFKTK
jgi:hypothetical protein